MAKYIETATTLQSQGSGARLALIEIRPSDGDQALQFPTLVVTGLLDPKREWFAETPVEILLSNGIVVRAVAKGEGLSWLSGGTLPVAAQSAGKTR